MTNAERGQPRFEPFIIRWPAVVKPGCMCGQFVHHLIQLRAVVGLDGIQRLSVELDAERGDFATS